MGLQFSSEGSRLSLRPLASFSVFPTPNGVHFNFGGSSGRPPKVRLEVKIEQRVTNAVIVATAAYPVQNGPISVAERCAHTPQKIIPL